MSTAGGDLAVDSVVARLALWLQAIRADLERLHDAAEEGADSAASAYVSLLVGFLAELNNDFQAHRGNTAAPAADRLRWLQKVGASLTITE